MGDVAVRSAPRDAPPPTPPAQPPSAGWRRTFYALRHRDFAVLMASALVHMLAMQMGIVAFSYMAYDMTGSATVLGLMGLAWGIPMLTLSLIGGVVADRFPRRSILICTQSAVGIGALVNALLIFSGLIEIWHLFAVALVQGTAFAFNMPARQAFVADIVGREDLSNAIALNNANMNMTRVFGPAVAGFLIASPLVGVGGVFALMAAMYVVVVFTMFQVKGGRNRAGASRSSGREQLAEGLRHIRGSRALLTLLGLGFIPMLLGMHYQTLMPVFAISILGVGAEGLGLLSMSAGIGALIGSLSLAALGDLSGKTRLQSILGIALGLSLIAFALAGNMLIAVVTLLIVGATSAGYQSLNNALLMENTPREFYGRVMSVYMMTFSLMPLASVPAGRLAELVGAPLTVGASGLLLAAIVAILAGLSARSRASASPETHVRPA